MEKCSQLATPNGLRLDQLLIYCWIDFFGGVGDDITDYKEFANIELLSAHYAHLADII